ncbi:MAG: hypothetical protein ACKOE2_12980, partial [Actinomycetales bacterium]
RHGVLAGATNVPAGLDPRPWVQALVDSAASVAAPACPVPAGLAQEAGLILTWLESDDVRLVRTSTPLSMPAACGGALRDRLANVPSESAIERHWSAGERPIGPVSRPVSRLRVPG